MLRVPDGIKILLACWALILVIPASAQAHDRLKVVTSFSILADMVSHLGGDHVEVYSLVGAQGDVHVYQPRPEDAKRLAQADLLVINGLDFEGWIPRLIKASAYRGPIVVASDGVPLLLTESAHNDDILGDHAKSIDPHAWQSLANARVYADNIVAGLIAVDSAHREFFETSKRRYQDQLDVLDQRIRTQLATIPLNRRQVLASHRAYAYFAAAYGVRFVAAVGMNKLSEPSAKEIAALIEQIRSANIKVAFVENISDQRLLKQIVRETGCRIGGQLYADSLSGPEGPAASYLLMMTHNLETLIAALSADAAQVH